MGKKKVVVMPWVNQDDHGSNLRTQENMFGKHKMLRRVADKTKRSMQEMLQNEEQDVRIHLSVSARH